MTGLRHTVGSPADRPVCLGVGIGYLAPELKAAGVAFNERGSRTDEYLEAMRAIWSPIRWSMTVDM
jgi:alkanesulfonate monooxygenase SsuD/methylene tetrahydromethanopterin reductase-like flavin-dependent oxidoreductase (luciferase family)